MFALMFVIGLVLISPFLGIIIGGIGMFICMVFSVISSVIGIIIYGINEFAKFLGGGE